MDFKLLPTGPLRLENVTVPACLVGQAGDLLPHAITLAEGRIVAPGSVAGAAVVDMAGAMVLPAFIDMHTHLDKGHISPRAPNRDGTFGAALDAAGADRLARWNAQDLGARMQFSLEAAWAHGTQAIRTHLDAAAPQDAISFAVFAEMRAEWAGRITLQAASLVGAGDYAPDGAFRATADLVAKVGGALGMVSYPLPDIAQRIRGLLRMAAERGLDADFHADETLDPAANTLALIARAVLDTGFAGRVVVGHCCSMAAMAEAEAQATLDLVARAGLHVVSLPMCNLYLQDRHPGRTPRHRGITLVQEMRARGISVSFASDNTRDPFYAYGDMDMLEVLREATRIGHLDHGESGWVQACLGNPARAMGLRPPGLAPGAPADLVICKARSWSELFARPQADRIVIRQGRQIPRTLPDYARLDPLMEPA